MSAAKRRISGGKTLLPLAEMADDDDDDDIFDNNNHVGGFPGGVSRRNSLGGRRRASFGSQNSSKSPMSAAEQTRIADMYKTVIKMSTENKINDKNSWTFDLIDHMGKLIKDDAASQRGINFQKASCTLDASVKIYSHRVDDTHSSSHRILESLSRSYGGDDDEEDNDDGSQPTERRAARVGSKAASSRLNIAETLEKDPEKNLNAPMVDSAHTADPLFHKMSKAFDEGGAKGMLMTNLRISSEACSLFFASPQVDTTSGASADTLLTTGMAASTATDTVISATTEAELSSSSLSPSHVDGAGLVDVSDLIFKCGFTVGDLLPMTVSSALDDYRLDIGIEEQLNGLYDKSKLAGFIAPRPPVYGGTSAASSSTGAAGVDGNNGEENLNHMASDYYDDNDGDNGDDDDNDYDYSGGDYADENDANSHRESFSTSAQQQQQSRKIQWEPVRTSLNPGSGGLPTASSADATSTPLSSPQKSSLKENDSGVASAAVPVLWQSTGITSTSDYAFFDIDAALKSNSWAGARHWKYATRSRAVAATAAASVTSAANEKKKKQGASADGDDVEENAEEASDEEDDEENEDGEDGSATDAIKKKRKAAALAKSKKAAKAKDAKFVFNFTEFASEELFEVPKAKGSKGVGGGSGSGGDSTRMTAAALAKEAAGAAHGELFLPPDAKLQTRDLCRLLMTTNIIVPPPMLAHVFLQSTGTSSSAKHRSATQLGSTTSSSSSSSQGEDIIWGQPRKLDGHNSSSASAFSSSLQGYNGDDIDGEGRAGGRDDHYDGDEGGGGDFYEDDDGDDDNDNDGDMGGGSRGYGDDDNSSGAGTDTSGGTVRFNSGLYRAEPPLGLAINTANLLRATRTVEKIDIGYATIAKRVNVRKLKSDIWNHVDRLPSSSLLSSSAGGNGMPINDENSRPLIISKNGDTDVSTTKSHKYTGDTTTTTTGLALGEGKMSFQDLMRDISSTENQKDATLPFYFICLLHLANEKTLSIEGLSSMGDLIISKDV